MDRCTASALTHLLVVADTEASRDGFVRVLEATVHGEYGDSVALQPVDRGGETRAFFRDPDGHLFEISERT